ncbi:MAG: NAD(P)-dependent oxidoreductase [Paracoccaceae bacterium]
MPEKPVIGFIGLGFMGQGMAANLRRHGHDLWVLGNRNRAGVERLLSLGAQEGTSPADLAARCDIVHLCLSNSDQVESVVLGESGIFSAARPGLIVIDTTTADPASTLRLGQALADRGAVMVDAPLGRTPKEAEAGTLDAMVGCDEAVFETVRPVIGCWAATVTRIGPPGSGHRMKLLMNFLSMSYAALYAEALALAVKAGIPPQTLREVIGPSRMGCGFFDTFTKGAVDRDEAAHRFTIANGAKDLRYVAAMGQEAGMVNLMAAAARQYFAHAVSTGHGGDYVPVLADIVSGMSGVDLPEAVRQGARRQKDG